MKASRTDGPYQWVQSLVGWAALALVLLSVIPIGGNRPVVWTLLGFGVLGLFAVQMLLSLARSTAPALARGLPLLVIYFGVIIWGAVQIWLPASETLAHPIWDLAPVQAPVQAEPRISADPSEGRHFVLRLITYGLIAWMIAASALNSARAWGFVKAIAVFSTLLAIYGLYAALTGINPILGIDDGAPRVVSATFVNRNSYATYAAFGLFANLAVLLSQSGRMQGGDGRAALRNFLENFFSSTWIFALGGLLCATGIALSASRGGGISALLGALVLLSAARGKGKDRKSGEPNFGLWFALIGIIGFTVFVMSSNTVNRFLMASGEEGRFAVFHLIYAQIFERPWLGHGLGAFHDTFRPFVPLDWAQREWSMAHNSYLENFYELGIPAAAIFYLVFVLVALRVLRGVRARRADHELPSFALACMVAGGVHAMFDFSLQMPGAAALFAAILGLGWVQSFPHNARAYPKKTTPRAGGR
jgi:O-antigen ligase